MRAVLFAASSYLLLATTAVAQIGGSRWTSAPLTFNVQKPYNVPLDQRYTVTNGVYHLWVYNTDEPFSQGNTTRPRTEQRFTPDYTSGEIQYQSMMMVPDTETSNVCLFQIHTGDAQSPTYGATQFMLFWYNTDGGSLHYYSGEELVGNLQGKWFQLNVDHNTVTGEIQAWVNGNLIYHKYTNGATDFYMKDGVYMQNGGSPEMQVYIKDINFWTSDGRSTSPTPAPTATPKPTATATPKATPTATPKPTATATPKPTATATPSGSCAQAWAAGVSYAVGEEVSYGGENYRCIQAHTSEVGWEPPNVPALWSPVGACN